MSAPTVERPGAPVSSPELPWPLRFVAAIGRLLLRLRRGLRTALRWTGRGLERIGRSPAVAAPIAALSVALVGLTVVGLVVAAAWWGGVEPAGPWRQALSITGSAWVMTYGVPVRLVGVDYSLIPWGLALMPLWLSHQAGRWLVKVVRPRRWRTLSVTWLVASVSIALFVAAASLLADLPDAATSTRRAAVMGLLISAVGLGSGLWRASELPGQASRRIPLVVRVMVRASLIGFIALVGLAAFVLVVAAAMSITEITSVLTALAPTALDGVVLAVLTVGYLPTMIAWSLGYAVGAGVAVGPDVLISPFISAVPPTLLPTFPPLAALPQTAGPVSWALPALTVLAGALIGLAISRWAAREGPLIRVALALLSVGLAALWVFAFLWLGTGSLGDGRLAQLGPDAGLGALLAGVGMVIGALPTSILRAQRRPRRLHVVPVETAGSPAAIADASHL